LGHRLIFDERDNWTIGTTPQSSSVQCCPSCQIVARAVARLAYNLGYTETGDEITELMGEVTTSDS
jgi:hypothetical protein